MSPNSPDIELWNAFKEGDRKAFEQLFRRHYSALVQYGNKLSDNKALTEDCIQDLFVEAWQSRSGIQVRSVKAYLFKALKYKIFKMLRKDQTLKSAEALNDDLPFIVSHDNFLIYRQEDEERSSKIISALKQLSNRQKEIIYLKITMGLSYEEVSEIMGIKYQVCRNLFSQAIKALRKIMIHNDR